jgi:hypothetical protein
MWKWIEYNSAGKIKVCRRRSRRGLLKPVAGLRFIEMFCGAGLKKLIDYAFCSRLFTLRIFVYAKYLFEY